MSVEEFQATSEYWEEARELTAELHDRSMQSPANHGREYGIPGLQWAAKSWEAASVPEHMSLWRSKWAGSLCVGAQVLIIDRAFYATDPDQRQVNATQHVQYQYTLPPLRLGRPSLEVFTQTLRKPDPLTLDWRAFGKALERENRVERRHQKRNGLTVAHEDDHKILITELREGARKTTA